MTSPWEPARQKLRTRDARDTRDSRDNTEGKADAEIGIFFLSLMSLPSLLSLPGFFWRAGFLAPSPKLFGCIAR